METKSMKNPYWSVARAGLAAAAIVILTAAVSACGGGSSGSAGSTAAAQRGGTLHVALATDPETLAPASALLESAYEVGSQIC